MNYNLPFAASVAVGHVGKFKNHDYIIELEGIYSRVGSINDPITMSYTYLNDKSNKVYGFQIDCDRSESTSVMVNTYHYLKNNLFASSPYIGAGVGITRIKRFEEISVRPAYQLKAGLNYRITKDIDMHIGYRHFGTIGANFKLKEYNLGIANNDTITPSQSITETDKQSTITNSFSGTHSLEVGITIRYAIKA